MATPAKKAAKKAVTKAAKTRRADAPAARAPQAAKRPAQPKAGPRGKDAALLQTLREYMRAKSSQLLEDPNVTSVGIGHKQIAGVKKPQLAIQFTVERKAAPEALEALGTRAIPEAIDIGGVRVPTDVIERSYKPTYTEVALEAKGRRKARADVIEPGISVGNVFTSAGTIGAFVRDRATRAVLLLSNWHVLHGPRGFIGVDVVQPGRHDDNRVEFNKIGTLLRSHLGPAGDCALSTVSGRALSGKVLELDVEVSSIGDPEIGDAVIKSGRTTAVTRGKVVRIEVNTKMDYGAGVSAVVGGFEIGVDPAAPAPDGEISRGGDSGAAWLALGRDGHATGVMLGLHFAGDADGVAAEFALACYAKSVMTALEVEPLGALTANEAATLADGLAPRDGFDRRFLDFAVDAPRFTRSRRDDLAPLDGDIELRYCHFSVWLSRTRKYPLCVAWNIDGNQFKRLARTNFRTERRGELESFQFDDKLYRNNPLDKGHIARRADLCWGSIDEARQGNYDSFYYTNIVPQHEAFNQSGNTDDDAQGGVWGRLENTVFDAEAPHQLRISVIAGPVFGARDRSFEQNGVACRVPDEFWKVIAFRDDGDGREKVFGFLLTQRHLVEPLTVPEGLQLEPWLWARITLRDLQSRTGVRFDAALRRREMPFVLPEALGDAPPIKLLAAAADYFA